MHNVYLVQPNYDFGPNQIPEFYLPYTVGILWSYAAQFDIIKNNFKLAEIIFKRENIDTVVSRIENPKVVAFSCYVWNWEYNKELAKKIKEKYPNCIIVFGGPSVTDKPFQKLFFQKHRYVNCVINGEGEYSFKEVLQAIANDIPVKKIYEPTRINDLSTIPSPYLTGVFDDLISNNTDVGWQMVLETNRGCPFACTFCDWGSLTYSKIKKFDYDRVINELNWSVKHKIGYIYIADANFGIFAERDKQISIEIAKMKKETGYPQYVAVTWNKNAKMDIIEIAKILGSRGLTVSMQSMDDQVLEEIKRKNMDISDLSKLLPECEKAQVPVYTELILGLPYETKQTWRDGHYKLLDYQQHAMLEVYLSMILENSELNSQEQIDKHGIAIIEAENYLGGNSNIIENGIVEKIMLIQSTKHMSNDDMIDSFMFSWLILMFHYIGYTQIYSRYLNFKHKISYQTFYDNLFNYIKNSSGLLNTEYNNVKNIITIYLTTGKLDTVSKFNAGANIIWNSTKVFPQRLSQVQKETEEFFQTTFNGIEPDVIVLQQHFTVDIDKTYPYTINISLDVYNSIFTNTGNSNHEKINLKLDSAIKETDIESFCRKIYTGRRSSSSKVIIEADK